jgi:hypothetical protein
MMFIAPRMRLLRTSPSCYGFFIHVAFIFHAEEIAGRVLTTKQKGSIACCGIGSANV